MFMYFRKISVVVGSVLLTASVATATDSNKKLDYVPANPDKYPYPSVTTDKNGQKINNDGAVITKPEIKANVIEHSLLSGKGYDLGVKATKEQSKAWDTDVRPDGKGLPAGSMTVAKGAEVYMKKCGTCHGDFGEGVDKFPVLSGGQGTLTLHPSSGAEPGPLKTIGSYMPYIAPIYWYIQTAMPLNSPKSLSDDQVYGIIGYLLQVNEIQVNGKDIEDDTVIDAKFLKSVHLPNEKGFEYNNLRVADTHNTRCMKNCYKGKKVEVMEIKTDGTVVEPEFGEERWFFGELEKQDNPGAGSPAQKLYESICAGCHDSGVAGAPILGDKTAWTKVINQGQETVYEHALKGFNGMPPKGGAMDASDKLIKETVDFMIKKAESE